MPANLFLLFLIQHINVLICVWFGKNVVKQYSFCSQMDSFTRLNHITLNRYAFLHSLCSFLLSKYLSSFTFNFICIYHRYIWYVALYYLVLIFVLVVIGRFWWRCRCCVHRWSAQRLDSYLHSYTHEHTPNSPCLSLFDLNLMSLSLLVGVRTILAFQCWTKN